jgi:hypothetical protein
MPEWLEITLGILEKLCLIAATVMAYIGINAWRREMLGRKKADLAEEVLAGFYETRDALRWVRSPLSDSTESESRIPEENEDPATKRRLDSYFVPIARLNKHNEHFAKLQSIKYRFMAYFGAEAEQPFNKLSSVRQKIVLDASSLIREDLEGPYSKEEKRALKATIGWCKSTDDPIRP